MDYVHTVRYVCTGMCVDSSDFVDLRSGQRCECKRPHSKEKRECMHNVCKEFLKKDRPTQCTGRLQCSLTCELTSVSARAAPTPVHPSASSGPRQRRALTKDGSGSQLAACKRARAQQKHNYHADKQKGTRPQECSRTRVQARGGLRLRHARREL
ncbi:hypothetical protein NDU88_004052 [Pleurodeles waltl]|uniref:Uncharacterized protein n=1 Tax=Pleurodeles waltl TaxID=8319 RepID=A0AAV7TQ65_PLEWA|nr:hypothetical protein NDU88_004052 [Pleurodeles waltl]